MDHAAQTSVLGLPPHGLATPIHAEQGHAGRELAGRGDEGRPGQPSGWRRTSTRLTICATGLVLLALFLPAWLVDAVSFHEMRSLKLPDSADRAQFLPVASWVFSVRSVLAGVGAALAAPAWWISARRRVPDYIAAPTVLVGAVVACLSAWLAATSSTEGL